MIIDNSNWLAIAINSKITWRFLTKYKTFFFKLKDSNTVPHLKIRWEKFWLLQSVQQSVAYLSRFFEKKKKNLYSNWFSKHLFVHFSKSLEDRIMASSAEKTNGTESKPPLASLASWVRLNVGGTVFATTVTTLAKDPDSFLYRICRTDDKDYLDSHKVNS